MVAPVNQQSRLLVKSARLPCSQSWRFWAQCLNQNTANLQHIAEKIIVSRWQHLNGRPLMSGSINQPMSLTMGCCQLSWCRLVRKIVTKMRFNQILAITKIERQQITIQINFFYTAEPYLFKRPMRKCHKVDKLISVQTNSYDVLL